LPILPKAPVDSFELRKNALVALNAEALRRITWPSLQRFDATTDEEDLEFLRLGPDDPASQPEWIATVGQLYLRELHDNERKRIEDASQPHGTHVKTATVLKPRKQQQQGRGMPATEERVFFEPDGPAYRPLIAAAQLAQTPAQTLRDWVNQGIEFEGRPLDVHYSARFRTHFLTEESIARLARRFTKGGSDECAGDVTIGSTKDRSGYIGTTEAARILNVSSRTAWLWASQGAAPSEQPLDVIQCKTSGHFYISERDVYALKKLIPRTGLPRGRRPKTAVARKLPRPAP
jgi:hypothetical protein